MSWTLGLTGGAGSGKSTAAAVLHSLGFPVIDADAISRALTAPGGAAMPEIRTAFGDGMMNAEGALDRPQMRALVFSQPDARRTLEAIVHKHLARIVNEELRLAHERFPIAVYDCPLLIESSAARSRADRILVIDAPAALQIERLGRRSGLSPEVAARILAAQTDRRTRLLAADDVIVNDASQEDFLARVRAYGQKLLTAEG